MKFKNHRKMLKSERQAIEEAERGEIVQIVDTSDEIPFGVKALEQEPAIEGVWNAKTTTPLHTPNGSRGSSPRLGPLAKWHRNKTRSSASSISALDIEERAKAEPTILPDSKPSARPDNKTEPPVRRKKANSITISYSGPSIRIHDEAKCGLCDTDCSGLDFTESSTSAGPKLRLHPSLQRAGSLRRRFVIGGRPSIGDEVSAQEENQSTIDRMNAHRKLHSAESGQLMPRTRRHTTEIPDSSGKRSVDDESNFFRTSSWPTREQSMRLSPQLPQKAERRRSPPAVPQSASVETQPTPKFCPSAWTNRTQAFLAEKASENRPLNTERISPTPSLTSNSTLATSPLPNDHTSIPNTQTRKINEGLEILPAGTFEKEPAFKILGLWPATIGVNSGRRKSKKLQKHSRSDSVSSTESNFSYKTDERISQDRVLRQTVC